METAATHGIERLRGNYVLVRAGRLRLLLPQQDIGPAQHGEEGAAAVVCLCELLMPAVDDAGDRFVSTTLRGLGDDFRFAWSEVRVMIDAAIERHPLPPMLQHCGIPLEGYAQFRGEWAYCSSADALRPWIAARVAL